MSLRDIKKLFSRSKMEAGSSSLEDKRMASKEDVSARKNLMSARRETKGFHQNIGSSERGGDRKLR